jgi:hypothetical protein
MKTHRKKKKRTPLPYTKGDLNKIVDTMCHPLFKTNESFRLVDGLLHALIEQNPRTTVRKFAKYNLPVLTKQLKKAIARATKNPKT